MLLNKCLFSNNLQYTNKNENNFQGVNSRVDKAKNQISELEYKKAKNTQSEQEKK